MSKLLIWLLLGIFPSVFGQNATRFFQQKRAHEDSQQETIATNYNDHTNSNSSNASALQNLITHNHIVQTQAAASLTHNNRSRKRAHSSIEASEESDQDRELDHQQQQLSNNNSGEVLHAFLQQFHIFEQVKAFILLNDTNNLARVVTEQNINARDLLTGKTPLMLAAETGRTNLINILQPHNPNVLCADNSGKSALDYSLEHLQTTLTALTSLQEHFQEAYNSTMTLIQLHGQQKQQALHNAPLTESLTLQNNPISPSSLTESLSAPAPLQLSPAPDMSLETSIASSPFFALHQQTNPIDPASGDLSMYNLMRQ